MSDYQPLTTARTYAASRQAIWDAWTKPEEFKQWFMPAPFSVPSCEMDVRPGGHIKVDTQGPDGTIMPMSGEFKVVEEPSRLVMTNSLLDAEGNELFEVQHSVDITEDGEKTLLTITSEVLSAGPDAEQFLNGMEAGLNQALDQMTSVVSAQH